MSDESPRTKWFEHRTPEQRLEYAHRFRRIAERGEDIDGEARFIDAMADRGSTILDAGCGTGRVAAALAARGHTAAGIDVDPTLIEKGREFYPGLPLAVADLTRVGPDRLAAAGLPTPYDLIVCAGNVMLFLTEGSEGDAVSCLAGLLRPGGRAVFGFQDADGYTHDALDRDARAAGWLPEHRFGTWQLEPAGHGTTDGPAGTGTPFAVSVYRAPERRG